MASVCNDVLLVVGQLFDIAWENPADLDVKKFSTNFFFSLEKSPLPHQSVLQRSKKLVHCCCRVKWICWMEKSGVPKIEPSSTIVFLSVLFLLYAVLWYAGEHFYLGGGQAQGTLWTNISWYVATTAPAHVQSVIHCVLRTGTWKNTPTIFTLPTRNLGLLVGCGDLCFSIHCILCWMLFYAIHFTSHWGRASLDDRFVIIIVSPKQELLRSQHKITIIAAHTKYDSLLVYVESFWWTS